MWFEDADVVKCSFCKRIIEGQIFIEYSHGERLNFDEKCYLEFKTPRDYADFGNIPDDWTLD